jgi:integrase
VTVADALDRYQAAVVEPAAKPTSRRNRMRVLRRAMERFLTRPVATLSRGDLIGRLDEIQAHSGGVSRNRAQSEMRHFLGWCRDRDLVPNIVIDRIRQGVREQPRDRVLTDIELTAVLAATADRSTYSDFVRTLVMTAMRRNEAASLRARDVDIIMKTITITSEVSKTRISRTIPLPEPLCSTCCEDARAACHATGICSAGDPDFKKPFSGFSKRFARLTAVMPAEIERWTLHDLRRTAATRMHEMGVDALVVNDLLGHLNNIRGGVRGIYNKADTMSRQREAVALWSAKLATLALAADDRTNE